MHIVYLLLLYLFNYNYLLLRNSRYTNTLNNIHENVLGDVLGNVLGNVLENVLGNVRVNVLANVRENVLTNVCKNARKRSKERHEIDKSLRAKRLCKAAFWRIWRSVKESVWQCIDCEGTPSLCLTGRDDDSDCWRLWHAEI